MAKTADGVTITIGMTVYDMVHNTIRKLTVYDIRSDIVKISSDCGVPASSLYHDKSKLGGCRCEGYRRRGGAFTFGPVRWYQCEETATVMISFKQEDEKVAKLPACNRCWAEGVSSGSIEIIEVKPITQEID
ncbi:hypothetical protein KAR91_62525 [Candidatus Pacearchaeota archaeon]|nr:hypothetical protein [Candidatus Pacearchaeota archaeon]